MNDIQTMLQAEMVIDGARFLLAQNTDLEDLKGRIEAAVQSPGTFVDFTVVGNRSVSAIIAHGSRVVVSIASVQFDPRDTGIAGELYGGLFDF